MATISQLQHETAAFFKLHWPSHWGAPPVWSGSWDMQTGIANPKLAGAYALFLDNGEVGYVGKGSRKADAGVARRLTSHVVKSIKPKGPYQIVPIWAERGVTSIRTIGFADDCAYLAVALESFLIKKLQPQFNTYFCSKLIC
jgi:hypothetical protein